MCRIVVLVFFFNDTATTEIYTLSLHDALPIFQRAAAAAADDLDADDADNSSMDTDSDSDDDDDSGRRRRTLSNVGCVTS